MFPPLPPTIEKVINTPRHTLKLDFLYGFIPVDQITIDKERFTELCKSGCRNYNQKYSCPPLSPSFLTCFGKYPEFLVVMLKIDLSQLSNYKEYHQLRVGNAVIKPRLERIMRSLEAKFGGKYLSTGACRLCKPCQKKIGKPCKHPDKMRFSLESLGVDCDKLSKDVFNLPLLWYQNHKAPAYTAVICAYPLSDNNEKDQREKLIKFLKQKIVELK